MKNYGSSWLAAAHPWVPGQEPSFRALDCLGFLMTTERIWAQFQEIPLGPLPPPSPKMKFGPLTMSLDGNLLSFLDFLCPQGPIHSVLPLTFEAVKLVRYKLLSDGNGRLLQQLQPKVPLVTNLPYSAPSYHHFILSPHPSVSRTMALCCTGPI